MYFASESDLDSSGPLGSARSYFGFVETSLGMHRFELDKSLVLSSHFQPDSLRLDDELQFIFSFCKGGVDFNTSRSNREAIGSSSSISSLDECRDLLKIVQENTSIAQITKEIEDLANATISKYNIRNQSSVYNPAISHSSQLLLAHIESIGLQFVESVNSAMDVIKLKVPDRAGRVHLVEVKLPPDYPRSAPSIYASLPEPICLPWSGASGSTPSSIADVIPAVEKVLHRHGALFDVLEHIDSNMWVLDPVHPTFATTSRRIVVDPSCSILLEISLANPKSLCEMKFFGSADKTAALKAMLSADRHKWMTEKTILENLELIFQRSFPSKPSAEEALNAGFELECGICYTYSIKDPSAATSNDMLTSSSTTAAPDPTAGQLIFPEVHCDNSKCGRVYHHCCLVDWLKSLPSTRISFHTLFGCCPYCQEPLCVKAL